MISNTPARIFDDSQWMKVGSIKGLACRQGPAIASHRYVAVKRRKENAIELRGQEDPRRAEGFTQPLPLE
jgi:hypothetical protein